LFLLFQVSPVQPSHKLHRKQQFTVQIGPFASIHSCKCTCNALSATLSVKFELLVCGKQSMIHSFKGYIGVSLDLVNRENR